MCEKERGLYKESDVKNKKRNEQLEKWNGMHKTQYYSLKNTLLFLVTLVFFATFPLREGELMVACVCGKYCCKPKET